MGVLTTVVTKFFLKSKGIWGIAGMAVVPVAEMLGYHVVDTDVDTATKAVAGIWQAATTLLAIWGRVTATQPLSISTKPVAVQVEQTAPQGGNIRGLKKSDGT